MIVLAGAASRGTHGIGWGSEAAPERRPATVHLLLGLLVLLMLAHVVAGMLIMIGTGFAVLVAAVHLHAHLLTAALHLLLRRGRWSGSCLSMGNGGESDRKGERSKHRLHRIYS
jgi:hypothetical protein